MVRNARQLLRDALELPEDERAGLVYGLLNSMGPETPRPEPSYEEWIAEIERRARAVLAGEPGIPWEEARAEIRQRLSRR
jgi:putative addiction module component (TIGR02574 family)